MDPFPAVTSPVVASDHEPRMPLPSPLHRQFAPVDSRSPMALPVVNVFDPEATTPAALNVSMLPDATPAAGLSCTRRVPATVEATRNWHLSAMVPATPVSGGGGQSNPRSARAGQVYLRRVDGMV